MHLIVFINVNVVAQIYTTTKVDAQVKELVSKMTLEEKIGQMTQVTIQAVSKVQGTKDQNHQLDLAKLEEAIKKYHVGSILNVYDVAHTAEYWHEVINKIQNIAVKETRLGIPVLYGIDAIHGVTYTKGSTLFPQSISMAATWNTEIAKQSGEITSFETKASGICLEFLSSYGYWKTATLEQIMGDLW